MILFFIYKANIEYAVGTRLERSYQKSKEIGYIDTPETIEDEWTESDEQELDIETRKYTFLMYYFNFYFDLIPNYKRFSKLLTFIVMLKY